MQPGRREGFLDQPSESGGRDTDHDPREIIRAEPKPLTQQADNARIPRADHLHLGSVIKPHLAQSLHQVNAPQHLNHTSGLTSTQ
jgi:hypothetical protein